MDEPDIEDNIILYVDAGTRNNGQRGKQNTIIVICDKFGTVLIEKWIGDFTNNEGEILAIVSALEDIAPEEPKELYSDSTIAVNWATNGWKPKLREKHRKAVGDALNARLAGFIEKAGTLLLETNSNIEWISRDHNLAGHYTEKTYSI